MKRQKIIILRGKNASGKTSTFYSLRDYSFKDKKMFKNWIFIDNNSIKRMFSNLNNPNWKDISKEILIYILEKVLPLKKDIMIEETSKEMLNKYLGNKLNKYNYKLITFQFEVSLEEAIARDKNRVKEKTHPGLGKVKIKKLRDINNNSLDKEGIIVDTDKLDKEQVVKFIIQKIKSVKNSN